MSDNSRSVLRDKKGHFVTRKRKQWLDNVAKNNAERKRLNDIERSFKFQGRRIVELDTLAEELWCKTCKVPLSLRDTVAEKRYGLASVLEVRCRTCRKKYNVNTCKSQIGPTGDVHFPINDIFNTDIEPSKLNDILSALNIPAFEPTLTEKCVENLAHVIEECADDSFAKAIPEEKAATSGDKVG